jgi:hypothetical protein
VSEFAPVTPVQVPPLFVDTCQVTVGAGVPVADETKVTVAPAVTVEFCGCVVIAGAWFAVPVEPGASVEPEPDVTPELDPCCGEEADTILGAFADVPARSFVAPVSRSEAVLVIAEPDGLWKMARNFSPRWAVLPTTEYTSDVAPRTRAQDFPLFLDTCHCARGVGAPDAFASKRARAPRATATVTGCIVIRGAVAVGCVFRESPDVVRRFGRTTAEGRAAPTKPAWQARMVAVVAMPVARRRWAPLWRARSTVR